MSSTVELPLKSPAPAVLQARDGQTHDGHEHHRHRHEHAGAPAARAEVATRFSLLALSGGARLLLVSPLIAGLIALTFWAISHG